MRRRKDARRGAVAVVAMLCLIPMIGVTALVIDVALFRAEQRRAQAAADAASYAAVRTYDKVEKAGSGDPMAAATAAALAYASACGFTSDATGSTVTTALQSQKPERYGTADVAIRVEVTPHLARVFSGIWGGDALKPRAASVSVRVPDAPPSIVLMNPRDQDSLVIAGGARIVAEGGVQVRSNAGRAANINNMGSIKAPTFKLAGNYQLSSSGWIEPGTATSTGSDAAAMVDPMEGLAQPNPAGMTTRTSPSGWNPTNPYPISPGVYNSGLTLNSGGMNYTMAPGLYYIKSGNFVVSNGVRVTGSGVTVYLYDGNIDIQGGEGINLTPPTNGTYQDIAIMQRSPKNAVTGDYTPRTISIANGTNNKIGGKIYAPGATMTIAGGSNNTYGTQLIVNKLNLSNNARMTLPKATGSADAKFYLAE